MLRITRQAASRPRVLFLDGIYDKRTPCGDSQPLQTYLIRLVDLRSSGARGRPNESPSEARCGSFLASLSSVFLKRYFGQNPVVGKVPDPRHSLRPTGSFLCIAQRMSLPR